MKKTQWMLWIGLAAFALSGCSLFETASPTPTAAAPAITSPEIVIAEGYLVPARFMSLAFSANGTIVEILVEEGDAVVEDQVLARLGDREAITAQLSAARLERLKTSQQLDTLNKTAALAKAQANQDVLTARQALIEAQAALDAINMQDFRTALDDALLEINDTKTALEDAQEAFDDVADLSSDNPERTASEATLETAQDAYQAAVRARQLIQLSYDRAKEGVDLAQAGLDEANRKTALLENGPDPDALAQLTAALATIDDQIAALESQLAYLEIRAPYAGTIAWLDMDVNEQAAPGKPVITLADTRTWYVETDDLTEIEVVNIAVGQRISIEPDALPGLEIAGEVESISNIPVTKRGDITYTARIRLDPVDEERLRWGMTVTVRFDNP